MTLSKKQREKLANIQNMINYQKIRNQGRSLVFTKPDRTVFYKMEKLFLVMVQNAPDRAVLDSAPELHQVLTELVSIANTTTSLSTLRQLTTDYKMEQCQLILLNAIIDHPLTQSGRFIWSFNDNNLLPSSLSYWKMMQ